MTSYHLAQLNIAKMQFSIESAEMSEFVDNLNRINALADSAAGFVWRLQSDYGDATSFRFFGSDTLVNMSVWTDIGALHDYVYRTAHAEIMSRRKEWFHTLRETYTVLWWIRETRFPQFEEARDKLDLVRRIGPSPDAFTFKNPYPAPDMPNDNTNGEFDDLCPAT